MGFRHQANHKKNCVYYRLGKHQSLSRPQYDITGTQEDLQSTREEKEEEEEEKGERKEKQRGRGRQGGREETEEEEEEEEENDSSFLPAAHSCPTFVCS